MRLVQRHHGVEPKLLADALRDVVEVGAVPFGITTSVSPAACAARTLQGARRSRTRPCSVTRRSSRLCTPAAGEQRREEYRRARRRWAVLGIALAGTCT